MNSLQKDVLAFMRQNKYPLPECPVFPPEKSIKLYKDLIEEETIEWYQAIDNQDLVEYIDALVDLIYVTLNAVIGAGIDMTPFWDEVQRSNMSKMWTEEEINSPCFDIETMVSLKVDNNLPRCYIVKDSENHKTLKSPSYIPANLKAILQHQIENGNNFHHH